MPVRRWRVDHAGHEIELVNFWSPWPLSSYEELWLDGQVVARSDSNPLLDFQKEVGAEVVLGGKPVVLSARIGPKGVRVGGQIFVDGQQVGGDAKIQFTEPEDRQRMLRGGFFGYFLRYGVLQFGVFYGLTMAGFGVGERAESFAGFLWDAVRMGLPFALMMSGYFYLVLKRGLRN